MITEPTLPSVACPSAIHQANPPPIAMTPSKGAKARLTMSMEGPIAFTITPYSRLPPSSFFFSRLMFIPRPLSSLQSTSNATGMPASSLFVPLTMLS
jgi:hypothetical protein